MGQTGHPVRLCHANQRVLLSAKRITALNVRQACKSGGVEIELRVILSLAERQHAISGRISIVVWPVSPRATNSLEVRRAAELVVEVALIPKEYRPVQVEVGAASHQTTSLLIQRLHQITHVVHV